MRAGVAHRSRGEWTRPMLHVTLRMAPHVYNLRSQRSFRVIAAALRIGGDRFNVRIVQFSVQGNHIHLLVEAPNRRAATGVTIATIREADHAERPLRGQPEVGEHARGVLGRGRHGCGARYRRIRRNSCVFDNATRKNGRLDDNDAHQPPKTDVLRRAAEPACSTTTRR